MCVFLKHWFIGHCKELNEVLNIGSHLQDKYQSKNLYDNDQESARSLGLSETDNWINFSVTN